MSTYVYVYIQDIEKLPAVNTMWPWNPSCFVVLLIFSCSLSLLEADLLFHACLKSKEDYCYLLLLVATCCYLLLLVGIVICCCYYHCHYYRYLAFLYIHITYVYVCVCVHTGYRKFTRSEHYVTVKSFLFCRAFGFQLLFESTGGRPLVSCLPQVERRLLHIFLTSCFKFVQQDSTRNIKANSKPSKNHAYNSKTFKR